MELLGKVGQVLRDLGNKSQRAGGAIIGIFLQQVEERRGHDGRAEEAEEQRGADQPLANVRPAAAAAFLPPGGKDFLQLSGEHAAKRRVG